MSRTHHPRPAGLSDAHSRVRNAAAALADQLKRVEHAQSRLRDTLNAARTEGLSEQEIMAAIGVACVGRPDRARQLERYAATGLGVSDGA